MHLVEVLAARSVPAAGVSLGLTRRCPLSCAHCATESTLNSQEIPASMLLDFVSSFGGEDRPEFVLMSGGEPLLRPGLVCELAATARTVGARSLLLSGVFFARTRRIPKPIKDAIKQLDHFSVSLDVFHEQEVPRANVFDVLDWVLSEGIDVSIHMVGRDADDPYLENATEEVRRTFDGRVPIFVNGLSWFGRARQWLHPAVASVPKSPAASPCPSAAWPVVGFDGTVVACGNDDVINGPTPDHLLLGHVGRDSWSVIRARCLASAMVRAIRLYGPENLAARFSDTGGGCDGYCGTCMKLSRDPTLGRHIEQLMDRSSVAVLENQVLALQRRAGAVSFARLTGLARYADLVALGAPS
jgi:pyruvate-formate lyase-activating enzyme